MPIQSQVMCLSWTIAAFNRRFCFGACFSTTLSFVTNGSTNRAVDSDAGARWIEDALQYVEHKE